MSGWAGLLKRSHTDMLSLPHYLPTVRFTATQQLLRKQLAVANQMMQSGTHLFAKPVAKTES